MAHPPRFRATLQQLKPVKGDVATNLEAVRAFISADTDLVVFPETVLSGYFVEGAVNEVALSREELVAGLGTPGEGSPDVVIGFYERYKHDLYNSLAYLTPDGDRFRVVHTHRKVFLPTYGLFEEGRFVEPGRDVRAFDTRLGRMGMLVCEDMWHSLPASILALDGATTLICGSASPARGFRPSSGSHPENLAEWDRIGPRTAREHGVFLLISQLVGSA